MNFQTDLKHDLLTVVSTCSVLDLLTTVPALKVLKFKKSSNAFFLERSSSGQRAYKAINCTHTGGSSACEYASQLHCYLYLQKIPNSSFLFKAAYSRMFSGALVTDTTTMQCGGTRKVINNHEMVKPVKYSQT